jgi:hypothetical protein
MKKRILMVVVLVGLIGLLAGAYAFGTQQPAQACHTAHDILIVDPQDNLNVPQNNDWNENTVDTFSAPEFDIA